MYAPESRFHKHTPAETTAEFIRQALVGVVGVADGNRHAGTGGCGVGIALDRIRFRRNSHRACIEKGLLQNLAAIQLI